MKKLLFLAIAICCTLNIFAQAVESDSTLVFKGEKDYTPTDTIQNFEQEYLKLEPQVLADIKWLNSTPLNEELSLRDDKSRFVLMWISGVPYMDLRIDDRIVTFSDSEPWLLMAYMTGWAKYFLENNYSNNEIQNTIAAVKNVVAFYKKNGAYLNKDKAIDAYVKMEKKGTLESYITSILTVAP